MTTERKAPFDQIGKRYEDSFVERDLQVAEGAWLIEQLGERGRVLDLGCGSGVPTARQLLDAGHEVVGIDESTAMLELAREHGPNGDFRYGDLRDLRELADLGEFDAAVAFFSFVMLPKADVPAVLAKVRSMLRGPRLLQLSTVLGDFDMFPINFLGVPMKASAFPPDELKRLVTDAGFEVTNLIEYEAEAEPNRIEVQLYLRARAV